MEVDYDEETAEIFIWSTQMSRALERVVYRIMILPMIRMMMARRVVSNVSNRRQLFWKEVAGGEQLSRGKTQAVGISRADTYMP